MPDVDVGEDATQPDDSSSDDEAEATHRWTKHNSARLITAIVSFPDEFRLRDRPLDRSEMDSAAKRNDGDFWVLLTRKFNNQDWEPHLEVDDNDAVKQDFFETIVDSDPRDLMDDDVTPGKLKQKFKQHRAEIDAMLVDHNQSGGGEGADNGESGTNMGRFAHGRKGAMTLLWWLLLSKYDLLVSACSMIADGMAHASGDAISNTQDARPRPDAGKNKQAGATSIAAALAAPMRTETDETTNEANYQKARLSSATMTHMRFKMQQKAFTNLQCLEDKFEEKFLGQYTARSRATAVRIRSLYESLGGAYMQEIKIITDGLVDAELETRIEPPPSTTKTNRVWLGMPAH